MPRIVRLIFALAAVGAICGSLLASSAGAAPGTLHRPFPQGIHQSNAGKAWNQVTQRANVDASYARQLANSAGARRYNARDWRVQGYGRVTGGANSGVTAAGATVATRDTATCRKGARALKVKNIKTGRTIEICVGCGNPRLRSVPRSLPRHRWSKGTVLKINKKLTIKRNVVCPATGQKVRAVATFRVRGRVTGRSWGVVQGRMRAKLRVAVNLKLQGILKVKCVGAVPPAPQPPAPPAPQPPVPCPPGTTGIHPMCVPAHNTVSAVATATASANVRVTCPGGTIVTVKVYGYGEGQASAGTLEEANRLAKKQADDNAAVALARAKADVDIDVVCGSAPPPPPPPPADKAPLISAVWPPHVYVGGSQAVWIEARDPDGDPIQVDVKGDSFAQLSSLVSSNVRWDGSSCPSDRQCYRATLWGLKAGTATLTATVTAGGKVVSTTGQTQVVADEF